MIDGAELAIEFTVWGKPIPAGSKKSGAIYRKDKATGRRVPVLRPNGSVMTYTQDDTGESGKSWRGDVRDAVKEACGGQPESLLDGPLVIEATFYGERPRSHYGSGKNATVLKASAPRFPHERMWGDGTKLLRALEDALNAFLIRDDKRFVRASWAVDFGRPRAEVRIWSLPTAVGDEVVIEAGQLVLADP